MSILHSPPNCIFQIAVPISQARELRVITWSRGMSNEVGPQWEGRCVKHRTQDDVKGISQVDMQTMFVLNY